MSSKKRKWSDDEKFLRETFWQECFDEIGGEVIEHNWSIESRERAIDQTQQRAKASFIFWKSEICRLMSRCVRISLDCVENKEIEEDNCYDETLKVFQSEFARQKPRAVPLSNDKTVLTTFLSAHVIGVDLAEQLFLNIFKTQNVDLVENVLAALARAIHLSRFIAGSKALEAWQFAEMPVLTAALRIAGQEKCSVDVLYAACISCSQCFVERLLDAGILVDVQDTINDTHVRLDDQDETPTTLLAVACSMHSPILQRLLDAGADPTEHHGNILFELARCGDAEKMKLLIADVHPEKLHDLRRNRENLLLATMHAKKTNPEIIKLLLEHGFTCCRKETDVCAFQEAAALGRLDMLKMLNVVNVDHVSRDCDRSTTPLLAAIECGQRECVTWLLEQKASVDFRPEASLQSPLECAVSTKRLELIPLLLPSAENWSLWQDEILANVLANALTRQDCEALKMLGTFLPLPSDLLLRAVLLKREEAQKVMVAFILREMAFMPNVPAFVREPDLLTAALSHSCLSVLQDLVQAGARFPYGIKIFDRAQQMCLLEAARASWYAILRVHPLSLADIIVAYGFGNTHRDGWSECRDALW
jgi:ankyrin repeat protein